MAQTTRSNIWIDGSQANASLAELKKRSRELNNEIAKMARGTDEYKQKLKEANAVNSGLKARKDEIRGVSDEMGKMKSGLGGINSSMLNIAGGLGVFNIASSAIGAVGSAVTSWYTNNLELEKSLSQLKSITGATTKDVEFYKEQAIEAGKETTVSATATVRAFALIGSARPDLLANKEALAGVTREAITLSEAAGMELEPAAQAVTGALNQFNLAGSESSRIVNAYAAGSKAGAAEIEDLSASIDKSGGAANAYNVTLEETVGVTELLSEKNLKGAEAGTQMKNVFLTMSGIDAIPAKALGQLEKFGVNLQMVKDTTIPFNDRLKELSKIGGDTTAIMEVFGKENFIAAQAMLNGVERSKELTEAVTGTGTAYEQASINTDNMDGDLKRLGTAWEGLTVTVGGASNAFRPLIQAGADVLNWTSDTIVAFKEMDGLKIETQFLKLADAVTLGIGPLHDLFEQQIRMNEITSEVVDVVQKEAEANYVLTESLMANNAALLDQNLSTEEKNRLEDENASIIDTLNEKYPELTANIDFNKITVDEMNALQKDMNKTMVQQAIETAKVAEQERILNEIITQSVKQQRLRAELANNKGSSILDAYKFYSDAQDLAASNEELAKQQKYLNSLQKDFAAVEKTIMSMNLNVGNSYDVNATIIKNAEKEVDKLEKKLKKATDPQLRKQLESQIKGMRQSIKNSEDNNQQLLDETIAKTKEKAVVDLETTTKITSNREKAGKKAEAERKKQEKEAEQHIQQVEKMLADLGDAIAQANTDFAYNEKLKAFEDEQAKEIFIAEETIKKKYAKDIEMAQKVSQEKGELGAKGSEQLAQLQLLQTRDFEAKKKEIEDKYRAEKYEKEKEENLQFLKMQETLEDSKVDLRVQKATLAAKKAADADVETRKAAYAELDAALTAQLELENLRKKEALMDQLDQGLITREEYDNRIKENKAKLEDDLLNISMDSDEKMRAHLQASIDEIIKTFTQISGLFTEFMAIQQQVAINKNNDALTKQLDDLKAARDSGMITEQQYQDKKRALEEESAKKEAKIKTEAAKKQKAADLIIAGTLAILQVAKAAAALPPPANIPLILMAAATGAAQVASIAAQPIPQFKDGGFNVGVRGANDGKYYDAEYLGTHPGGMLPNRPVVLASEAGREYYVPSPLLQNHRVMDHVNAIEAYRTGRTITQFAEGGFNGNATSTATVPVVASDAQLIAALNESSAVNRMLLQQLQNGITAKVGEKAVDDIFTTKSTIDARRG